MKFLNHRRINNILTTVVIGIALYMILAPLWPGIVYRLGQKNTAPYGGQLAQITKGGRESPKPPEDNRIVIPSAKIDQPIIEGGHLGVIDKGGSWRKPINTGSPKDPGNTVIVGHRFTYTNPSGAFYHLDKVRVGDKLALYWEGEELLYEVSEIKVVTATAVEVENNSSDRLLTIYTCTPLVTAQDRLVLVAKPYEVKL